MLKLTHNSVKDKITNFFVNEPLPQGYHEVGYLQIRNGKLSAKVYRDMEFLPLWDETFEQTRLAYRDMIGSVDFFVSAGLMYKIS